MIGVETLEVNVYYRDHRFTTLDFHIQRKHSNVSVAEVNAVVKFTHEITVYTMYMLNLCTCQQSNNSFEWISFEWMVSQHSKFRYTGHLLFVRTVRKQSRQLNIIKQLNEHVALDRSGWSLKSVCNRLL